MIWYKFWFETRGFFIMILAAVILITVWFVLSKPYDQAAWQERLETKHGISQSDYGSTFSTYQGYIWTRLIREPFLLMCPLLAMAIASLLIIGDRAFGVSGIIPEFTLSLPITRRKLLIIGGLLGLVEMTIVICVPFLSLSLVGAFIDQAYSIKDALIHGLLMAFGSAVFFSLTFFLSTWFRKGLIGMFGSGAIYLLLWPYKGFGTADFPWWSQLFTVMSGQSYFLNNQVPWIGLLLCAVLVVSLTYLAVRVYETRDF